MMKLPIVLVVFSLVPFAFFAANNVDEGVRAPRPDALSYPGSTPEIASPFNAAQLEQIQQCICQIKNILTSPSCNPTVIAQTGDIVISEPGFYCLANNVGNITVTSSFVTLDMSGRIAGSIVISGAASGGIDNIIIENGFIYNSVLNVRSEPIYRAPLATSSLEIDSAGEVAIINVQIESDSSVANNINITNAGNVIIYNTDVMGGVYGVNVDSVNTLLIQYSNFTSCQQVGIRAVMASSNQSLIAIEDSVIKDTGPFGITGGGVNSQLYVANSQILLTQSNALGLYWTYANGNAAYCENVIVDSAAISFQLEASQSKVSNCVASNYNSYGFIIAGDAAIFENCTARAGGSGIVGFFIQQNVSAVFNNCQGFYNDDSGFRHTSTKFCKFYNCNALLNKYGFLLEGPCTLYNCDSSSNTYRGFELNSFVTMGLYNCNALVNAADGFFVRNALGVINNCAAIQNVGNGFNIQANVEGVFTNCFATGNQEYGFFDTTVPAGNPKVAYSGNSAVGNVLGDFNAEKGKAPFFWKFAKNQAITLFDNAVIEILI